MIYMIHMTYDRLTLQVRHHHGQARLNITLLLIHIAEVFYSPVFFKLVYHDRPPSLNISFLRVCACACACACACVFQYNGDIIYIFVFIYIMAYGREGHKRQGTGTGAPTEVTRAQIT
jgi:hypothetical protein